MIHVSDLFYGTMVGGPHYGALAIHLEIGSSGQSFSPRDLVRKIANFPQGPLFYDGGVPYQGLHISGNLTQAEPQDMFDFTKAIKDWGFRLAVTCDGQSIPPWFDHIDWKTVVIARDPWLMFACHEVRLIFEEENTPEPELAPGSSPLSYIIPSRKIDMSAVFAFIRGSKRAWKVLLTPARYYRESMLKDEADE